MAKDILELQKASYEVEAEIIGCRDLPPLKESVADLQNCGEEFHAYYSDGKLAGAISIKRMDGILDIHRLMVHPAYFRKGIATALLAKIEEIYPFEELIVSTGAKNGPAIRFYERHGFRKMKETMMSEGILIACYKKARMDHSVSIEEKSRRY